MKLFQYGVTSLLLAAVSVCCLGQTNAEDNEWTGTWAAAPSSNPNGGIGSRPETIREIVHVSTAGRSIRVTISNMFGTGPLRIGHASAALREIDDSLKALPVVLNFNGGEEVTIPAGSRITSDPAFLDVPALSDVAVSLFIPKQELKTLTVHSFANDTNYVAPGDQTMAMAMSNPVEYFQWPFLTSLDVQAEGNSWSTWNPSEGRNAPPRAVVCLGDSITAGFHSTPNANHRWTNTLAIRLQANERNKHIGVLNEGIPGNRVLHNGAGPSALSRFDRDVLSQTNVKYLIISEGINDVGVGYGPKNQLHLNAPTAQDLESAYTEMAAQAHAKGMKVIGATLTPYEKAKYFSNEGDAVRQEVNSWIRTTALTSHIYDGVVDFDLVLRANNGVAPEILNPLYDSGDGLHPNDAGYRAMGEAIQLGFFADSKGSPF